MRKYTIVYVIAIISILKLVESKPHSVINLNELNKFNGYHYEKLGDHIANGLSAVTNIVVGKAKIMQQMLSGENERNNLDSPHRNHNGNFYPPNQGAFGKPPFGRPPFGKPPFHQHPQSHFNQNNNYNPCYGNQGAHLNPICSQSNHFQPQPNPIYPQQHPFYPTPHPTFQQQYPHYPQHNQFQPPTNNQINPQQYPMFPQQNPTYPQYNPNPPQQNPLHPQQIPTDPQQNPLSPQTNPMSPETLPAKPQQEHPINNIENTPTPVFPNPNTDMLNNNNNNNDSNNGALVSGIVESIFGVDPSNNGNQGGNNNNIKPHQMDTEEMKESPINTSTTFNPIYDIDIRIGD